MSRRSNTFPLNPAGTVIPVYVLLIGPTGKQFVRMALDTGATYTMAPIATLQAIGCDPSASRRRVEFIAAGGVERKPLVRLKAIHVLGVRLTNIDVVCHDLPPQSSMMGLLGLNVLKHMSLRLDFPRHRLIVSTS